MKLRNTFHLLVLILCIVLAGEGAYYAFEIYQARRFTLTILLPKVKSANYPLQLSDLTPHQLDILLKVEDPSFFKHGGVDFHTPGQGITTITQGLVKMIYFEKFQPGLAKVKQTLIAALVLDPLMSKEDQLLLFINSVHLGGSITGFEQAARHYFNKPFAQLSEDEYIALVATIIAPATFNPRQFPQRNLERVARIKKLASGEYKPRGLFDLYYGALDAETQKGLPPFSYFESYYK